MEFNPNNYGSCFQHDNFFNPIKEEINNNQNNDAIVDNNFINKEVYSNKHFFNQKKNNLIFFNHKDFFSNLDYQREFVSDLNSNEIQTVIPIEPLSLSTELAGQKTSKKKPIGKKSVQPLFPERVCLIPDEENKKIMDLSQKLLSNINFLTIISNQLSPEISGYYVNIKFKEGEYSGEILNGKRHGFGKFVYFTENPLKRVSIIGWWFNDQLNRGKRESEHCVYEGDLLNGVPHGFGIATSKNNKLRYSGNFKHGKLDGAGVLLEKARNNSWNKKNKYEWDKGNVHSMDGNPVTFLGGQLIKLNNPYWSMIEKILNSNPI